jgi:hypothetical protein
MWSRRKKEKENEEEGQREQGISYNGAAGRKGRENLGDRGCFIVSFCDATIPDDPTHTIETIKIQHVVTPPADLLKQGKEIEIRSGRAIILDHQRPPLATREIDLLNAFLAFTKEKCSRASPVPCKLTIVQAQKYEGPNPSSLANYEPQNLAMQVTVDAYEVWGEELTLEKTPPTLSDIEAKDLESKLKTGGAIEYQVPRPNSLHNVKHNYWWTWLVNTLGPDRYTEVSDASDDPFNRYVDAIECWSYWNQTALELRACSIPRSQLEEKFLKEAPKHEGMPPAAGLKLFHCPQDALTNITLKPVVMAMNESFSVPLIRKHLVSNEVGFLGRVSGAEGEFGKSIRKIFVVIWLTIDPVFILKRAMNTAAISAVVSFNPKKNLAVGYMISGSGQYSIKAALPEFPLQFSYYPHPMLVFILVLELIALKISENLKEVESKLSTVESRTGYSHRISRSGTSEGEANRDLAKTLGAETCRFVVIQSSIANAMMLKDFIQEQLLLDDYTPVIDTENFKEAARSLLERAKIMESTLKHMVTSSGIEGRLQAQQNVVSRRLNHSERLKNSQA